MLDISLYISAIYILFDFTKFNNSYGGTRDEENIMNAKRGKVAEVRHVKVKKNYYSLVTAAAIILMNKWTSRPKEWYFKKEKQSHVSLLHFYFIVNLSIS